MDINMDSQDMMKEQLALKNFVSKVEKSLLKRIRETGFLVELCKVFRGLYGMEFDFALEFQLNASFVLFIKTILKENIEKKEDLLVKIEGLEEEKVKIEKRLKQKILLPNVEGLPVYQAYKKIRETVDVHRQKLKQRLSETKTIKAESEELKAELGMSDGSAPHILEIPSEEQLESMRYKLKVLRHIKKVREQEIMEKQKKIKDLLEILTPLDRDISMELVESDNVQLTEENERKLSKILLELTEVQESREEFIANALKMLEGPSGFWFLLDVDKFHQRIVKSDLRLKQCTVDKLRAELDRCYKLEDRRNALPELMTSLQLEIIELLEKVKKSYQSSIAFVPLKYTIETLERYESERDELQYFYAKYQKIFALLEKREVWKTKLEQLNNQVDTRNRLKNRGGQLLMEEKERKKVERSLLESEVELIVEAEKYEKLNHKPFIVYEKPIQLDYTAKTRLELKKQNSFTSLRLKKPLGNVSTNH